MRRPTANRDQAIILTLLDSGIRASEFCSLRVEDFEAREASLKFATALKVGQKVGRGESCTWERQPGTLSGDIYPAERMVRKPTLLCSQCGEGGRLPLLLCDI
jgi:hypothetical protein